MRKALNPYAIIGFALTSIFAVSEKWTLPEFCWGSWLAALVFTWGCIVTAPLQIILTIRSENAVFDKYFPALRRLPPGVLLAGVTAISICAGLIAFYLYTRIFGFYGLFLSVWGQMEPRNLFGPNGFINSDFFTPVAYLLDHYWPLAVGVLVVSWEDLFRKDPWKRLAVPFQKEIVRLHVMILVMPFLTLIVYALFGKSYQPVVIVLLLGLLYLFPRTAPETGAPVVSGDEKPARLAGTLILPALLVIVFAAAAGFYTFYPDYLGKLDFTGHAEKPLRTRPVAGAPDHPAADREMREQMRRDHRLRGLTADEDNLTYAAAPDGIFAFVEPDHLFDPSRLVLGRQFRRDSHFEIYKEKDGSRLIGYISEDDDGKMKNRPTWTGFRVTLFNYRWSGAPVMYCVSILHLQGEPASRRTETDRGEPVLALELTHR